MHVFALLNAELSLGFFGTNVFGMVVVQRMKEGRGIPFGEHIAHWLAQRDHVVHSIEKSLCEDTMNDIPIMG